MGKSARNVATFLFTPQILVQYKYAYKWAFIMNTSRKYSECTQVPDFRILIKLTTQFVLPKINRFTSYKDKHLQKFSKRGDVGNCADIKIIIGNKTNGKIKFLRLTFIHCSNFRGEFIWKFKNTNYLKKLSWITQLFLKC